MPISCMSLTCTYFTAVCFVYYYQKVVKPQGEHISSALKQLALSSCVYCSLGLNLLIQHALGASLPIVNSSGTMKRCSGTMLTDDGQVHPKLIFKSFYLFQDITTKIKREWLSGASFSRDQHDYTCTFLH